MHIPYMMEQVVNRPTTPAMSLVDIRRGIEAAIGAIIEHGDRDLKLVGGRNSLIEKSLRGNLQAFGRFRANTAR